jgi:alcohol dehydrogenase (cytochrome c)
MTRALRIASVGFLFAAPIVLSGQAPEQPLSPVQQGGLDPAAILAPLRDDWLTYSGDYSGRRYSALTEVNQNTVKGLGLAWVSHLTGGLPGGGGGFGGRGGRGGGGGGGGASSVIVGGEGAEEFAFTGSPSVKGSILKVGDVLYVTAPDNVWALDVHDGRTLWRYFWKTRGGTHIGNRGAAMWHNALFFETPDDYLVSLDARNGKERWHVEIAKFAEEYFSTAAPVVIGNHLLVGTGNDTDMPGFLQSFDPDTGKVQWKTYTVPMNPGDPGLDTWPSLDAARHGGAQTWIPGAYDPDLHLYYIGTGNPTPGYTGQGRKGDNLFTCSLVAFNVDTGKMVWYYQTSPHDTHDWDSAQTPILYDAVVDGQQRKLISTASRNGYFYTLDRVTGKAVATGKFGTTMNWVKGVRPNGQPDPNPEKEATVPGSLVSPTEGGVTNWPPAAYSADTGLFYTHEHNGFNLVYLTETDPRGSMGLAGKTVGGTGSWPSALRAIDPKTAKMAWRHEWPGPNGGGGAGGVLTTAGKLVFTGDGGGNFVAFDAATGTPVWHTRIGAISNAPETFTVDGHQMFLVAVGDTLYTFSLAQ